MPQSSEHLYLARLQCADPDRYFCNLFAPPEVRGTLALLYLFNNELARARDVASEPLLARIRLQWWREVVEGEAKKHEIATPLSAALDSGVFARADLLGVIEAREMEAEAEIPDAAAFFAYARGTSGRLARIAGKILGADSVVIEDLGTAYGISGILRAVSFLAAQDRSLLPADATPLENLVAQARALLQVQPPRVGLAAALPAVFARRDLGKKFAPRTLGDKFAVLRAALTGRV